MGSAAPLGLSYQPVLQRRSERRIIILLIIVFWAAFQVIFFAFGALNQEEAIAPREFLQRLFTYLVRPSEIAIIAAGAVICFLAYLLLRQGRQLAFWKQLAAAFVVAIACSAAFSVSISLLGKILDVAWPELTPRFFLVDTLRWIAPFGLWVGVALMVTYNSEIRERERRLALLQAQAQDAQMRALRYQVNPHLLYNTLNSIAALILDRQNELAEAMVVRLANFFRASLSNDPHSDVPLIEELELQRIYLDIEQMRFPNLSSRFEVPADLYRAKVPSLILQPLIENALKHGANPNGVPTDLRIAGFRRDGRLVLEVSDNGPGAQPGPGTGVGLNNVRNRLLARFGDEATFEAANNDGAGFRVRMSMPISFA
jgi:signal transduction histidine kinase